VVLIIDTILNTINNFQFDGKVTVGFDGFIDIIIKPVLSRNKDGVTYFKCIEEFGQYISSKAHKSCSIELKTIQEKFGGNMPIYAAALAKLGISTNCIGAMGYPKISEPFKQMNEKCSIYSIFMPGNCQALEFDDGKIMLARNGDIEKLNYELLEKRIGTQKMIQIFNESAFISLLNWSELKGSTSIWQGVIQNILPLCSFDCKKSMLVDLSDCSLRDKEEIDEMLDLLKMFSSYYDIIFSLNKNEIEQLGKLANISSNTLKGTAMQLANKLKVKYLVVHINNGCFVVYGQEYTYIENLLISLPKILTGGGDNFNAGFTFAYLAGLTLKECLIVANATSGFYVAHGYSPSKTELLEWITDKKYI
jgi:sugar/nucleoside kinase (ribokinase family)